MRLASTMASKLYVKLCLGVIVFVALKTKTTSSFPSQCPTYWTAWGKHCYRFFAKPETLWENASFACESIGRPDGEGTAHLVSIHSLQEQKFVINLWKNALNGETHSLWIGLHDQLEENSFQWTDGSPLDYVNWSSTQPDNAGGNEHVVHMRYFSGLKGQWNDISQPNTGYNSPYVCKMPRY